MATEVIADWPKKPRGRPRKQLDNWLGPDEPGSPVQYIASPQKPKGSPVQLFASPQKPKGRPRKQLSILTSSDDDIGLTTGGAAPVSSPTNSFAGVDDDLTISTANSSDSTATPDQQSGNNAATTPPRSNTRNPSESTRATPTKGMLKR